MADINWVNYAGSTYSSSSWGSVGTTYGSEANCHDENSSTYYSRSGGGTTGSGDVHIMFEAIFAAGHNVNRINCYLAAQGGGAPPASGTWSWTLEYYDSTGWHTQASASGGQGGQGSPASPYNYDATGLTLTNVTRVKITCNGAAGGPDGYPRSCGASCNELYAYGPEDIDDGNAIFFGAEF